MNIKITNKYLSFEGSNEDAYALVTELHEVYCSAGYDMNKTLNDFLFSLEVALQSRGFLDENFNLNPVT